MTPEPRADMLILARESRGLTQTDLADKANVSQGYLSKAENGLQVMAEDKLAAVARALDYDPELFTCDEAIQGVDALFHRKLKTIPVSKLRETQAEINVRRIQVRRLLKGINIDARHGFPRIDPEDAGGPQEVARLVRRYWNIPLGPISDMVGVLEAAGGVVIAMSFATVKVSAAVLWPDTDERPLFFINEEHNAERTRFSLAHELAHVVMHKTAEPEWEAEADAFAAEFLMPAREIRPQLMGARLTLARLMDIKHYWKVAISAVAKRAQDLAVITDRQARSMFQMLNSRGYLKMEPLPLPSEEPKTLKSILRVHMERHGYTVDELGKLAFIAGSEFVRKFKFGGGPRRGLRAV